MNMKYPTMTATHLPDGLHITVWWLYPNSEAAQFAMETIQNGPFPEGHPQCDPNQRITIVKCSDLTN